ncbi:hypothetical protein A2U01_0059615, partial [Trifolium medium]|nr:hypothetical protein [Trifolium medium]
HDNIADSGFSISSEGLQLLILKGCSDCSQNMRSSSELQYFFRASVAFRT